jgi:hypothetical protein
MSGLATGDLRALVQEAVREVVRDLALAELGSLARPGESQAAAQPSSTTVAPATSGRPVPAGPGRNRRRVDSVQITNDDELNSFLRQIVQLAANPKTRSDLLTGALQFQLSNCTTPTGSPTNAPVQRHEKGAVTERHIKQAARDGARVVLASGAVLTPLARERARALNVPIEKEY